jgi:transposase InsO family protein
MAEQFPSYGPLRIAYLLQRQGVNIGKTAVYGVMKRNRLNRRKDRLEWIRKLSGEIITKNELETAREKSKSRHIEAENPGELVCIDTFYIGCLKGVGRIYQMTACDAASSFAWAKLYTDKSARSAVDFIDHILAGAFGINVKTILTDNGKEFTTHWASKKHLFENILKSKQIKHRYTKVNHPWTNGFAERLNRTILEEFYQVALRKKKYIGIQNLQIYLDEFIEFYNFKRPHQGYRLKGSRPVEKFITYENAA